jgi:hypothetical protein
MSKFNPAKAGSNEIQNPNGGNDSFSYQQGRNVLTLGHIGIPLTFACLREVPSCGTEAGIFTFELSFVSGQGYW